MNQEDSITIPILYIEIFVMMLGAFLIGYFFSQYITKQKSKARIEALEKQLAQYETVTNKPAISTPPPQEKSKTSKAPILQKVAALKKNLKDSERVTIQKRAFSDKVMSASTDKKHLDLDRIGRAKPSDSDDLQQIVGLGPHTERKLNQLGIFTFRQIANLTSDDVHIVTDLINFFPDRIKNDRWVEKARELYEQQLVEEEQ